MISGFVDECEIGDLFAMSAWVSSSEVWHPFSDEWDLVLKRRPAIRYFKSHEAFSKGGEFEGWTEDAIDTKISRLVDVICKHDMYAVNTGLRVSTYRGAFQSDALTPRQIKSVIPVTHPYHACFFSIHANIIGLEYRRRTGEKIDVVFDKQTGLFKQCKKFMKEMKPHIPADLTALHGEVLELDDKDVVALQAADLLAAQLLKRIVYKHESEHLRRMGAAHKLYFANAFPPGFAKMKDYVRATEKLLSFVEFVKKNFPAK